MRLTTLVALLGICAVTPVNASVIDFENLPHLPAFTGSRPSPFTYGGFTFTDVGQPGSFYIIWANDNPENAGGPGNNTLAQGLNGAITTVAKVGGGTFTLNSLDAADVLNSTPVYYQGLSYPIFPSYRFTFNTGGGSTQQIVTLTDGAPGLETLLFDRVGLLSFSFQALNLDVFQPNWSAALQFDNIVVDEAVSSVPVPGGWFLLLTGFAALCQCPFRSAGSRSRG